MTTAILQLLSALFTLAFAVTAWRIARRVGDAAPRDAAWVVVAVAFLWRAVSECVQDSAALWALQAGPGSEPYEMFVRWTPAVNHTRTTVLTALGWVLASLALLRGRPAGFVWRWAAGVAPLLVVVGFYMGWREGPTSARHVMSLAVLGVVQMVGIMVALHVALFAHTLDRYLWLFLCLYGVQVAMKVVWYSGAVEFFLGASWYPPGVAVPLFAIPVSIAGIFLARRRLALAGRGIRVPGVLEPEPVSWISVPGPRT